jgi:hypothetical protein
MKKNMTFKAELGKVLSIAGPYMFLLAIMLGALFSNGSWSTFFDKSFPLYLFCMAGLWLVVGVYGALRRMYSEAHPAGSGDSVSSYDGNSDYDLPVINPATGMPMPGDGLGGIDMGGHLLGHNDDD